MMVNKLNFRMFIALNLLLFDLLHYYNIKLHLTPQVLLYLRIIIRYYLTNVLTRSGTYKKYFVCDKIAIFNYLFVH